MSKDTGKNTTLEVIAADGESLVKITGTWEESRGDSFLSNMIWEKETENYSPGDNATTVGEQVDRLNDYLCGFLGNNGYAYNIKISVEDKA